MLPSINALFFSLKLLVSGENIPVFQWKEINMQNCSVECLWQKLVNALEQKLQFVQVFYHTVRVGHVTE